MNPVQYVILDHTLGMSTGKAAAQAAHAAIEGLRLNAKEPWGNPFDASIVNRWYQGGHYAKVVLETDQPVLAHEYLAARGFKAALIIDEGRTEFGLRLTATAIGCPVLNKDEPHVRETFSAFKLYSDRPQPQPIPLDRIINIVAAKEGGIRWIAREARRARRRAKH